MCVAARRVGRGFFGGYRKLWDEIRSEWRRDHNVVYYLIASAVFRDGLTGVFAFGAVLGVKVYGVSQADVLLFGVSASVIAAIGAVIGGRLDDRFGAKPVIVVSLTAMIVVAVILYDTVGGAGVLDLRAAAVPVHRADAVVRADADAAHVGGRQGGRRVRPVHDHGRAVSYLAPVMFSTFIAVFGTDRAGMGGLIVVLAAGLLGDAGGEDAGPGGCCLARRGADRQAGTGALLECDAVDGDRAVHFAADIDDADARGTVCGLWQLDLLAPWEQDIELRL